MLDLAASSDKFYSYFLSASGEFHFKVHRKLPCQVDSFK